MLDWLKAHRIALSLVSVCLTGGCQRVPQSWNSDNPGAHVLYSVDWWLQLVQPIPMEYLPREIAIPGVDPDLDPDKAEVVVATRDKMVRGISPEGRIDWTFNTNGPFTAGASVEEGVAYVPGGDGVLYALDVFRGTLVWRYDSGEELVTSPVIVDDAVLVAADNDSLYAVERKTGALRWRYHRENQTSTGFTIQGASTPLVYKGVAYIGFSDGSLVAIKIADGTVKWERMLSLSGKQFLDVDTTPVLSPSGRLFAASYQDGLYALDPETGGVQWHKPSTGITGIALQQALVFSAGDAQISAFSETSGAPVWSLDLGGRAARGPVLAHGVLVAPINASLLFVDAVTGKSISSWNPGKGVSAAPQWHRGRLYVLSNLGYLYMMRVHGGGG